MSKRLNWEIFNFSQSFNELILQGNTQATQAKLDNFHAQFGEHLPLSFKTTFQLSINELSVSQNVMNLQDAPLSEIKTRIQNSAGANVVGKAQFIEQLGLKNLYIGKLIKSGTTEALKEAESISNLPKGS